MRSPGRERHAKETAGGCPVDVSVRDLARKDNPGAHRAPCFVIFDLIQQSRTSMAFRVFRWIRERHVVLCEDFCPVSVIRKQQKPPLGWDRLHRNGRSRIEEQLGYAGAT